MIRLLLVFFLAMTAFPATALRPDEILPDAALETRARALGRELRCLVCQNQSIDDSDAELAGDLRRLVRERLLAGDSDGAVRAFLVARYGDFIRLDPPVRASTLVLWFGPPLLLGFGILGIALALRRRATPATPPLDAEERARLERVLAADDPR